MRRGSWLVSTFLVVCCAWGYAAVGAFGLSGGRAYEMVSPVFKGGFGVLNIQAVANDGNRVIFYSPGAFAGAPSGPELGPDYIAHRGALEWSTLPLMVPATLLPYVATKDVSPELDSVLALGKSGLNQQQAFQGLSNEEFLLHPTALPDTNETWALDGMPVKAFAPTLLELNYQGASSDFCHLLFLEGANLKSPLLAEGANSTEQVYELDAGCGGLPPALRLVAVKNKFGVHQEPEVLSPPCRVDLGGGHDLFNAVSDRGEEIFFTDCAGGTNGPLQLSMRLAGARTVEISRPLSSPESLCETTPCEAEKRASVEFSGASEDGSRAFFTAPLAIGQAPLVPGDSDTSRNLYMANIACPEGKPGCATAERQAVSLTEISHDLNGGEAAEVQRVTRVAPNGERVYFIARGRLSEVPNAQGVAPLSGANNLYMYDASSGKLAFIGDLCSGPETSGVAEDARCPSGGGEDNTFESQTAGADGRYLVFTTYAQLTADDTDAVTDVYRYDAVTGTLNRVSLGEAGSDANGNQNGEGAFGATIRPGHVESSHVQEQHELDTRAISEDGSRVVFVSSEPLSPAATNGLANAYEWHESPSGGGDVSLISGGGAVEPVEDAVISAQGNDIAFITVQGLVPQDTDGAPDLYDARVDGGFPLLPAPVEQCSGDGCQGPLTNPAPLLVPGSVTQVPGENLPAPKVKKPKKAVKHKKRSKKTRHKTKRASHSRVVHSGKSLRRGQGQ